MTRPGRSPILPMSWALTLLVLALSLTAPDTLAVRKRAAKKAEKSEEKAPPLALQAPETSPIAIVGGDVWSVTAEPMPGGTVLLRDGKIEAVLPAGSRLLRRRDFAAEGYEVIDATGMRVYPGLVSAGADGIGLVGASRSRSSKDLLSRRLSDSFDAWNDNVELAASAGITTAHVFRLPGFAFFFGRGGQGARRQRSPIDGRGAILKMSYGEPRGVELVAGASAWASFALFSPQGRFQLNQLFEQAKKWADQPTDKRKSDRGKELLDGVRTGEVPLFIPINSMTDTTAALQLADELGLKIVLYQPTEAWLLAEELAAAGVPVVQHVRTSRGGKARPSRRREVAGGWRFDAPARLVRGGVRVAVVPYRDRISTGGIAGRDLLNLPMEAAYAQRGGLTAQQALESITIEAARLLGVEHRVGSLERGKDADVIVADGDILDYRTFVRKTIVNGKVVYEAEGNRFWDWVIQRRDRTLGRPVPEESPTEQSLSGTDGPAAAPQRR